MAEAVAEGSQRKTQKVEGNDSGKRYRDDTAAHIFKVAVKIANAMKKSLNIDGLNIVQNNGEAAGQTVFHFHMHLIPRYEGDQVGLGWKMGELTETDKEEILMKLKK